MTQNASDVEIANQGFAAFRQDLNDVLEDITTLHSGTAAPSTTYANQWWYETDTDKLYIRNEDNDAWIEILTLDQANDKLASLGVILHIDDTGSTKQLEIQAPNTINNHTQLRFNSQYYQYWDITNDAGELKFGRGGTDYVTIDSSGNTGIGTDSPTVSGSAFTTLNVKGNAFNTGMLTVTSNDLGSSAGLYSGNSSSDNPAIMYQNDLRIGSATDTGLAGFAERARFLSGGGITFNGDTAAANALDDYEEGTWLPFYTSDGGTGTVNYAQRNGYYTKIGNRVFFQFHIMTSFWGTGGSGTLKIGGLPYTVNNSTGNYGGIIFGYTQGWVNSPVGGYHNINTTNFNLVRHSSTSALSSRVTALSATVNTDASSGSNKNEIVGFGTYFA